VHKGTSYIFLPQKQEEAEETVPIVAMIVIKQRIRVTDLIVVINVNMIYAQFVMTQKNKMVKVKVNNNNKIFNNLINNNNNNNGNNNVNNNNGNNKVNNNNGNNKVNNNNGNRI